MFIFLKVLNYIFKLKLNKLFNNTLKWFEKSIILLFIYLFLSILKIKNLKTVKWFIVIKLTLNTYMKIIHWSYCDTLAFKYKYKMHNNNVKNLVK